MKVPTHLTKILAVAFLAVSIPVAYADQGGFTNTGTSTNPPGTLTIGATTLTWVSADGTTSINATITTSSNTESCSGGGRGGHVSCAYTFIAAFSGTLTVNGMVQAINGSTNQYEPVGGTSSGTTGYNSAYTPFYYSDSEQILRADDLQGTNQITYGSQGSGVGQFYGAYGIAVDSAGRIYVADTYNCRVVRIDDMNGTNWTTYGTYGSGPGQFNDPSGIAVDSAGRIYVMDTGNSRLVRMDDMNGTNWHAFGTVGSGVGQFASFTSVAVDAANRIYVADTGNRRIVRMDDMTGTNWTDVVAIPSHQQLHLLLRFSRRRHGRFERQDLRRRQWVLRAGSRAGGRYDGNQLDFPLRQPHRQRRAEQHCGRFQRNPFHGRRRGKNC